MQLVMALTLCALFLVWVTTGVKLIRLAHRTRAVPEFLLGAALLLIAGIGYPLSELSRYVGDFAVLVVGLGTACTATGTGFLFAFTAVVFRPAQRAAWAAVGAGAALLAVWAVGYIIAQAHTSTAEERLATAVTWGAPSLVLCGLAFGWAGVESLRHHVLLRKRVRLGLADPVVANRMLLFGLMGSLSVGCVVADSLILFLLPEPARLLLLPLATAGTGLAVSVCMILAFWPPSAYLDRLRRGAAVEV